MYSQKWQHRESTKKLSVRKEIPSAHSFYAQVYSAYKNKVVRK